MVHSAVHLPTRTDDLAMATNLLTDRAILAAKPQAREYELTDGGGLALRIKTNGTKMWAVRYTSPTSGKRVREYIGTYPGLRPVSYTHLTLPTNREV